MLSVTLTVNVNVPAVVGLPVIEIGGDEDSFRPGGSCPTAIDAANGATPPEKKKFCKYDWPTDPALQQVVGNVISSGAGGLIVMLKAWRAVLPAPSFTWIVTVKVPARLGLPPIASPQQPYVEGILKPGGRLPATTVNTGSVTHGRPHEPPEIAMFWP